MEKFYGMKRDSLAPHEISAIFRHFNGDKKKVYWLFAHSTRHLNVPLIEYEILQFLLGHEGPAIKIAMMRAQCKDHGVVITEEDTTNPLTFKTRRNVPRKSISIEMINEIHNNFKNVAAAFNALFPHMDDEVGRVVFYEALNGRLVQNYKVDTILNAYKTYKSLPAQAVPEQ
jgi:hypothetical protein